ncbi:MAG: ABC transporter ATP-binding protein [Anaerolineae bacterium]|nr:ABC transporter ATP-binding protein [Anaerolineae bacterium]
MTAPTLTSDRLANGHRRIERLEMRGIVKRFPGVLALDGVDFDVHAGEVHALLGENGAGKSTLMKLLYGLYQPNAGAVHLNGSEVAIHQPRDAITHGIGMIHQHFMLVPSLTVAENVALGMKSTRRGRLDVDRVAGELRALSERYKLKVDPDVPIWQLAVGEQQRVEILRAVYKGAALLILDEPTAVLTPQEVEDLFRVLRQMAADGHALIFISHKLNEVLAISDRITVLRSGRKVGSIPTADASKRRLAEMMVGRPVLMEQQRSVAHVGEERLRLTGVKALNDRGESGLNGVTLSLRAGEIVGVAGVSGNGQHELAQVITGLRPTTEGHIALCGQNVTGKPPGAMNVLGIAYIPEERLTDGVIKDFSVAENYILQTHGRKPAARGGLLMNFRAIRQATREAIRAYEIRTPGVETPVRSLSGGNIQKLILARELSRRPQVLVAEQPTRGVDIGAIEYIHRRLLDERARGVAILLISEDLDEILMLADRIVVMYEGRIVGELPNQDVDVHQLGALMAGASLT